jgi:WD40 repeat protein
MAPIPVSIKDVTYLYRTAFEMRNSEILKNQSSEPDIVRSIACSPDSRHVAAGSWDEVTIIDYSARQVVSRLVLESSDIDRRHLEYDSTGQYLACMSSQNFYVWDVKSSRLILKQPQYVASQRIKFAKLNGNDQLFVTGPQGIQVYESWQLTKQLEIGSCGLFAIGPNARRAAEVSFWSASAVKPINQDVSVWDLSTGCLEWSHALGAMRVPFFQTICFHPKGNLLAVGQEGEINIWRIPEGKLVSRLRIEHTSHAERLSFSPDGQILIALTERREVDFEYPRCTLWDWRWKAQVLQLPDDCLDASFSPDGTRLIAVTLNGLQIWTVEILPAAKPPYEEEDPVDKYDEYGIPDTDPHYNPAG